MENETSPEIFRSPGLYSAPLPSVTSAPGMLASRQLCGSRRRHHLMTGYLIPSCQPPVFSIHGSDDVAVLHIDFNLDRLLGVLVAERCQYLSH